MTYLESLQNPKIKYAHRLIQKSAFRKKEKKMVVEGLQENEFALAKNWIPDSFFIEENIFQNPIDLPKSVPIYSVNKIIFEKLAYRQSTGGIIGIYGQKKVPLEDVKLKDNQQIVILEGVEKPGNLGAVLRSCDATKADAVIVTDTAVDIFHPNVIRSSVGTRFAVPVIAVENQELLEWLNANDFQIFTTYVNDKTKNLFDVKIKGRIAWVFGTEKYGVSKLWVEQADELIKIPMNGIVDSLNLSNSVAVCLYETYRQNLTRIMH